MGIGTTNPHPSALVDFNSASKGILLPRNTDPSNSVQSPTAGLLLYNTNTNEPNFYNGSQWQAMGSMSQQFKHAIAFPGVLYSASPSAVDFVWPVPEGVTSVWIEIWGAGDASSELPATTTSELTAISGGTGGDGGDYLSLVLPVTPGNTITATVGKGGTDANVAGGNSSITYGVYRYTVGQASTSFAYQVSNINTTPAPHVVAFAGGGQGESGVQSFQQSGSTVFRRVIVGGRGGDSFMGGRGGGGRTLSYDMGTGSPFPASLLSATGNIGSAPGGGGGAGFGAASSGGPGLIIIHY